MFDIVVRQLIQCRAQLDCAPRPNLRNYWSLAVTICWVSVYNSTHDIELLQNQTFAIGGDFSRIARALPTIFIVRNRTVCLYRPFPWPRHHCTDSEHVRRDYYQYLPLLSLTPSGPSGERSLIRFDTPNPRLIVEHTVYSAHPSPMQTRHTVRRVARISGQRLSKGEVQLFTPHSHHSHSFCHRLELFRPDRPPSQAREKSSLRVAWSKMSYPR